MGVASSCSSAPTLVSAISVFQAKFNVEFTRQAMIFSIIAMISF